MAVKLSARGSSVVLQRAAWRGVIEIDGVGLEADDEVPLRPGMRLKVGAMEWVVS